MAEKFCEHFLNYNSPNTSSLDASISELSALIDKADAKTQISMLPKLEDAVEKMKDQQSLPGLTKPSGWAPLIKLLTTIVESHNPALQERAFAVLIQLLTLARVADGLKESASNLAKLTLAVFEQHESRRSPMEVREAALHALKALLDKFSAALPPSLCQMFPELQAALLAILPDKSSEPVRELSAQCMGQLVKFHSDPASLFSVLSDMSADCELMLKDDWLLDGLLEQALGRENELNEEQKRSRGEGDNGGGPAAD